MRTYRVGLKNLKITYNLLHHSLFFQFICIYIYMNVSLQKPSGSNISTRTVLKMAFITIFSLRSRWTITSIGWSAVKHAVTELWSSENMCKCVSLKWWIRLHYLAVWWMNLGLVDPGEHCLPWRIVPTVECGGWGMVMTWVFFQSLGPLIPMKNNVNATAFKNILDNCFQNIFLFYLWQQSGK